MGQKNTQNLPICCISPAHGKIGLKWPQMGPRGFFPTNPDLADILGDTDFDFEIYIFWDFLDSNFPDFQAPKKLFLLGGGSPSVKTIFGAKAHARPRPDF